MKKNMRILIAYDGSDCAEAALDDLAQAGLPKEAEAVVVSVTEVWLPPPPASSYEIVEQATLVHVPADLKKVYTKGSHAVKEAKALAERGAARVRSSFPKWKVSAEATYGSPAWELVFKADKWKPDLIVVGSHGRSALGRFVLGSVSQRVLTEARGSVRVARGRVDEPDTPVRIIVGIDGSRESLAAVKAVAERHWPAQSQIRVVVVDDPLEATFIGELLPPVVDSVAFSKRLDRAQVEKLAEDAARLIKSTGLHASAAIEEGDPKHALPKAAEKWGANCIFVGATGFSNRFERFLLGSVSAAVAARAHCSVEVVRAREKRQKQKGKSNGN
jgi:nucleotide-binding universal stress UspA family protein